MPTRMFVVSLVTLFGIAAFSWQSADARAVIVVVTDEAGKPVPEARVICVPTDHSSFRTEPLRESEMGKTDGDGRCTFAGLPIDIPTGDQYFTYYILARTETLGAWGRADINTPDGTMELPLKLEVGRTAPGRAVDADGKPVADALVFVKGTIPLGKTDADGRFEVPNIPADEMIDTHFIKPDFGFVRDYARPAMQEFAVTLPEGGLVEGTALMPSGEPAAGALCLAYPFRAMTDEQGHFSIGWYPVGTNLNVSAQRRLANTGISGSTKLKVAAGENRVEVQLTPPEAKPQRSISGRVTEQGTGKPVQAEILGEHSPQFEWPKRLARTDEEGRYRIEQVPGDRIYLYAKPVQNALYCPEGLVSVDLRENLTAEGIDFTVAQGCAIRGKVFDQEGKPVEQVQVMFKPMKPFYRAIWTSASGAFLLDNLPEAGITYTLEVTSPQQQKVTQEAGPFKPGETGEATLQFPAPVAKTTVRGLLLDSDGKPVPGAHIIFPTSTRHIWTNSDQEGRFVAEFHGSADTDVQVSVQREVALGPMRMNVGPKITILEGGHIAAQEGSELEHTIRIAMAPVRTLGGVVQDPSGKRIDARVETLGDKYLRAHINEQDGRFFARSLPEEPFVLEVTAQGYRARILEMGKDFAVNDENLVVTLQPGPFPEGESVWTAVTGREDTEAEIAKIPGGSEVHRRCQEIYKQMARPLEERPQAPQPPPRKPVKTRVVDADGNPITRIVLWPQYLDPNLGVAGPPVFRPATHTVTEIKTSEDGVYELWGGAAFTAEATAPGWAPGNPQLGEESPEEATVTLYPASSLTIRVAGYDGNPVPGVAVGMTYLFPGNNYEHYEKTNAAGEITFELLNPLFYTFEIAQRAKYEGSWQFPDAQPRYVGLKVEPGQQYKREVVFGIAPEGSAQRLFDEWHKVMQSGHSVRDDMAVPEGLRNDMGDIVSGRFAALSGVAWPENREAQFLLRLVESAKLEGALPGLEEYFLRLKPPTVHPGPPIEEAANAIAAAGGDQAARFLADTAVNPTVPKAVRLEAALSIGETGSGKASKFFITLLKNARKQTGVTPADTPEAAINQTLYLVFHVIPTMPEPPDAEGILGNFTLTVTGDTAQARYKERIVDLKKEGAEWVITKVEHEVISMP